MLLGLGFRVCLDPHLHAVEPNYPQIGPTSFPFKGAWGAPSRVEGISKVEGFRSSYPPFSCPNASIESTKSSEGVYS